MLMPCLTDMSIANENTSLGILGASIGLAGLLLVFVGFIIAKADQADLKRFRKRYRRVAALGLVPLVASLGCAWLSIWSVEGGSWSAAHLYTAAKIVLISTGLYAILTTLIEQF